jgi:hypothetical protein
MDLWSMIGPTTARSVPTKISYEFGVQLNHRVPRRFLKVSL